MLHSTHQMLSALTRIPELEINRTQAQALAQSAANVARHYDVSASAKMIDWYNLAQVSALLYGSIFFTVRARRKAEREQNREAAAAPATSATGWQPTVN